MAATSKTTHVLVLPYPAQGHMLPLLDLARDLSSRDGLLVTVFSTPKNLPLLRPLLSRSPSIRTLVLPFPSHPSIPSGVENVKDLPPSYFFDVIHALCSLRQPLLHWARTTPDPPHAIISDFFLGWTHHLAVDLGIPRINFSPSAAITLAINNSLWRRMPKRDDPHDDNFTLSFPEIPNSPTYPWWQISSIYRRYKEGDPVSESIRDGYLANIASWGTVVNTFEAIDGAYLDHLRRDLGHGRVWAVGPLGEKGEKAMDRGGPSSVEPGAVMGFLDSCPDGSVVYVCFGSQAVLRKPQMEAVARALELSEVRFVWSVKEAVDGEEGGEVPEGFEERTRGKGVVVRGWAPQVAILGHAAVGVFVSHCGWNSVIEAAAAGVVVAAWPMSADQYLNARLLVEEMGIGLRLCEGQEAVPDAEAVTVMLRDGEWGEVERRAREMGRRAREAVEEGGSSWRQMEALVEELRRLAGGG